MRRFLLPALSLACAIGCGACGNRPDAAASYSATSITIVKPEDGWAGTIEYRDDGEVPVLRVDGVTFELRDPAAYLIDWEAIGMSGITTTSSFSYQSTEPVEGAFLSVSGKAVEIRDGELVWGETVVGEVGEGDVVRVDANGPTIL